MSDNRLPIENKDARDYMSPECIIIQVELHTICASTANENLGETDGEW